MTRVPKIIVMLLYFDFVQFKIILIHKQYYNLYYIAFTYLKYHDLLKILRFNCHQFLLFNNLLSTL